MKTAFSRLLTPLAAALALSAAPCFAQQGGAPKGAPGTNPGEIQITKVSALGDVEQRSPSLGGGGAKNKKWGVFDVTFQSAPEWVDEITVVYFVMLENPRPAKGARPLSLFRLSVSYPDVERGRDHKAGAVLLPGALKRYGRPIGFAVQLFVDGTEVAARSEVDGRLKGEAKWWESDKILNSPMVQTRDGLLLDRMKTPFRLIDPENYVESR